MKVVKTRNKLFVKSIAVTILLFLFSCSSSVVYVSKDDSYSSKPGAIPNAKVSTSEIKGSRGDVVKAARSFKGTKYKFGGMNKGGIDCSGLTYNSYIKGINKNIPRVANEQYKSARATSKPKPGDLVFFRMSSWFKIDHVGIYTGNNNMIHASSKFGVVEVSLNKEYYQKRLVGFGSIIE